MTPVIKAENLSKWYGNILGISDVTVEVSSGIRGLLGPNGAGKSTFLMLASGQLKPSIGKITILGEPVFSNHKIFSRIGVCPEYTSFYGENTGWNHVFFLAKLHGLSKKDAKEKTEIALSRVGLLENKNKKILEYSFGMQQRLKFAATIVHEPDVLILDEPLKSIDPLWRIKIVQIIKDFEKAGKTIIVSSHILPEIEAMTDQIILIHQGKIFAEGDVHYIRDLIDTHPHMISVKCAQCRELASAIINNDFIHNVRFDLKENTVTFNTNNRDHFYTALNRIIVERRFEIEEITAPDDNLQAVFDYLIGK